MTAAAKTVGHGCALLIAVLLIVCSLPLVGRAATWQDQFASTKLGSSWGWIREDGSCWSLTERPGFLRIVLQRGGLYSEANNTRNLLVQPSPQGDYGVEIYLEFTPRENFQKAGIVFYEDDDNVLFFGRAHCDEAIEGCVGNALYFDVEESGELDDSVPPLVPRDATSAFLRLEKSGRLFVAKYSPDGDTWTVVGSAVSSIAPRYVGLLCDDSNQGAGAIPADFGFVQLEGEDVIGNLRVNPLYAAVSTEQAVACAETWIRTVSAAARSDAFVVSVAPRYQGSEVVAYIATLDNGDFCITGANRLQLPVYAVGTSSGASLGCVCADASTADGVDSPSVDFVVEGMESGLQFLSAVDPGSDQFAEWEDELRHRASIWEALIHGEVPDLWLEPSAAPVLPTRVVLPLTSCWSQGPPYNAFCPANPVTGTTNLVVGCGATAMAQMMYYWQWPMSGAGSETATYTYGESSAPICTPYPTDPGIPQGWSDRLTWTGPEGPQAMLCMSGIWDRSRLGTAQALHRHDVGFTGALAGLYTQLPKHTFQETIEFYLAGYEWEEMRNRFTSITQPGADEAAEISYHAGVAAKMSYGVTGSGCGWDDVLAAFKDHFRYDPDARYEAKSWTTLSTLADEVRWMRPVLYGGSGSDGHYYVLYGYDASTDPYRQFLMNMGWGPHSSRLWYTLDPAVHLAETPFPRHQQYEYRIAPEGVVRFVGSATSGDGSPSEPYLDIDAALSDHLPDGVTLIFEAGSRNTFSGSCLVIDQPMTLRGINVTIGE